MKRILFITFAAFITIPLLSQEERFQKLQNIENNTSGSQNQDTSVKKSNPVKQDTVIVEVGDEIFSVREMGNETKVKIGKKEFRVVEDNDGVVVFRNISKDNNYRNRRNSTRFKGHIGGLELGLNGFLTDYWSSTLKPEDNYFDLYTAKSTNLNLSLPCVNIGFTRYFGISATLGINWNTYRFDGNNTIVKDENGVIGPFYPDPPVYYTKSKFNTTFATLPVLLEVQIPVSGAHNTINIGGGVIGGVKLGSNTKVVHYTDGKAKDKNKDDFSINTFRWGATGRVGYEFFQVYGTCYFTSMFEKGKGPELYPFEVGIAFTINN